MTNAPRPSRRMLTVVALSCCLVPRRPRRRRVCLSVRAARQGRGGRFPETLHVSCHPLPLADVCAAWRAGHSGADTLAVWLAFAPGARRCLYPLETLYNADGAVSVRRRALLAVPAPEAICTSAFPHARLLLTTVQPALEAAIAVEASCASPGALPLGDGLFAAPVPAPPARLRRMFSLRAEIEPLAAAASALEIVAAVRQLDWPALDSFCPTWPEWRLHHERVRCLLQFACSMLTPTQRGAASHRLPSHELLAALRNAMPAAARDYELHSSSCNLQRIDFVVLETDRGYLFGLVTCAPAASPALPAVWAKKPHNYCAGLPLSLATLAINLATALEPESKTVVDPCCGSGTVPFAAACLGAGSVAGVERHALLLRQARENLEATATVAAACCLQLSQASDDALGSEAPQLLCADSNRVVFETSSRDGERPLVVLRAMGDDVLTGVPRQKIDAIVSNLPYGRMVGVATTGVPIGDRGLESLAPLLVWLRSQAVRHAYYSGTRLAPLLRTLGYEDIDEICVDERGRRFLALASCGNAD